MIEAAKQLLSGLKSGVEIIQNIAPGLSLEKIGNDLNSELTKQASLGATEIASALHGGSAFVLYGASHSVRSAGNAKGFDALAQEQERSKEQPQPEHEPSLER